MPAKQKRIAIVVHGGAGEDSEFLRKHKKEYEKGIEKAMNAGYNVLAKNGSAVDAVEQAVIELENSPIFNAGRGSALNALGQVEMDAAIMDGKTMNSGAVALLQNVKNPISLAKAIMLNTKYRFLGAHGALDYAKRIHTSLEPDSYFITEYQYDEYAKKVKEEFLDTKEIALDEINQRYHGTVGAVALDEDGNLAASTSTGGTPNAKEGRIGDSCVIGAGCYANNDRCAISGTGDGEFLIKSVLAHSISACIAYKKMSVQEACDYVIFKENKKIDGDIGAICLDKAGNIGIAFNSERMIRGYKATGKRPFIKIYK
ncbi:MAG: asparaginase [Bacteroidota bacterium]|jgi:beta-aspartyl-peptidase (threonine type)|nr:asparaginase [Bacteroidota bacterium]